MRAFNKKTVLVSLLALALSSAALAHRVNVFAWTEGDVLHTESKFSGGTRVHFGAIRVEDLATKATLVDAKTNEKGEFSMPIPPEFDRTHGLKVTINAGEGHQSTWTVLPEDLSPSLPHTHQAASQPQPIETAHTPPQAVTLSPETLDAIESRIAARVAQEVAPLKRDLAALSTPQITLKDIIGGLGWILGLFGVGALVAKRKKDTE